MKGYNCFRRLTQVRGVEVASGRRSSQRKRYNGSKKTTIDTYCFQKSKTKHKVSEMTCKTYFGRGSIRGFICATKVMNQRSQIQKAVPHTYTRKILF
jgi:hypothetical protein